MGIINIPPPKPTIVPKAANNEANNNIKKNSMKAINRKKIVALNYLKVIKYKIFTFKNNLFKIC